MTNLRRRWIRLRRTRFTAASIPLCKRDGHLHFASAVQLRFDTIAVFDHARLVESGTHTALLAADVQYTALWNAQAKYYCSLQQHNNAAPGENEKMKEKAKKAAILLTSVQKCDLIYTERFGIVKTAGARTKQLQIAK